MTGPGVHPAIGVVVPCRDERAVIARKLRNLAGLRWPASAGGCHRLLVVDDGSQDGTGVEAERLVSGLFGAELGVRAAVVANDGRPGKAGALARGLAELGATVDVVVLTDADVVLEPDALVELAGALAGDAALAMASGTQWFVRDLAADGSCRGADGGAALPAGGLYDRWTAAVRGWESAAGKLFSVHGQLLAWRRELGLVPAPGIAADDLDLMLQVRSRGGAVGLVPGARFLEVKTPRGALREAQALRRARAYFQVLRGRRLPLGTGALDRLQWGFYRYVPGAAPLALAALLMALLGLLAGVAWTTGSRGAPLALGLLLSVALLCAPGRRLIRLMGVIVTARRDGGPAPSDRWEMERT